jgi:cell division septation protein DedD
MDPALKHRLIGAAVLSAVLVIFLPKLLVSHDTRSTAADVPLKMPNAPGGDFQTKELPLVTPASDVPQNGVVGMDTTHPAPPAASSSTPTPNPNATPASGASTAKPPTAPVAVMLPTTNGPASPSKPSAATPASAVTAHAAVTATTPPIQAANTGGRYVVSLGTYANAANAQSLVASLKNAQLPAYAEPVTVAGKAETRVRIGPYPQRGDAEAARLKAQQLRTDMSAVVTALDVAAPAPEVPATPVKPSTSAPAPAPAPKPTATPGKPAAPASSSASKPTAGTMDISAASAKPATPSAAAAGRGYVVQLVAFRSQEEALGLRDKLRAAGYTAFSEKVVTESATLYRVRVGPEADRDGADRLRAEVSAKFGLNGIVVAYP